MSNNSYAIPPQDPDEACCDKTETHPDLLAQATPNLLTDTEAVRLAELFKALSDRDQLCQYLRNRTRTRRGMVCLTLAVWL